MKNSMFGKLLIIFSLMSAYVVAGRYRIFPLPLATELYFTLAMLSFMGVGIWGVSRHYEGVVRQKDLYLKHFQKAYPDEYGALAGLVPIVQTRPKQQSTVEKEVL